MEHFYALAPEHQALRLTDLAREALRHWGIEDASIDLIKHRENAVFSIIDNTAHQRYALRIHRLGYHCDDSLRSELQWMNALTEAGVTTPPVIPTLTGELFINASNEVIPKSHQCDLLGWVDGEPLGSIESEHASDPDSIIDSYRIVGQLAGQLHNQSQTWQRPQGFVRDAWDIDGMIGTAPLWGRFWELEPLTSEQRDLLFKACEKAKQQLEAFGQSSDRYGLIHNDFLPENLLKTEDGIRIIDFDDAGFGWHLFEFATSLFFHLGEPWFDDTLEAMIKGYREVRQLPDSHLQMLPTFFLVRGLVYLGWVHTRKETETAKQVTTELIEGVTALAEDYLSQ